MSAKKQVTARRSLSLPSLTEVRLRLASIRDHTAALLIILPAATPALEVIEELVAEIQNVLNSESTRRSK